MADDHGSFDARSIEQADEISHQVQLGVRVDVVGHVGLAVAPLIGGDHVVPGRAERPELMAPRVPALGEAVAQHHGGAVDGPGFDDVHADAVGLDEAFADEVEAVADG